MRFAALPIRVVRGLAIAAVLSAIPVRAGATVSAVNTIVHPSTASAAVGNGATDVVFVTLKDTLGNPVPDKTVSLSPTGSSTAMPFNAFTDYLGRARFTVSDSIPETVTYQATDVTDGIALSSTSVSFVPDNLAFNTTMAVPSTTLADGTVAPVTVTLKDTFGNKVTNHQVALLVGASSAVVSPGSAFTDSNGQAVFSVSDHTDEPVILTLADGAAGNAGIKLATVHFQASSTTTISSSVNPSKPGQDVIFTATVLVASGTGTPTGTVTFSDGTVIGSAPLSGGQATMSTSTLTAGSHPITAVYSGDSYFAGSTSSALMQNVNTPPQGVIATATSPTTVAVSWQSSGASAYEIGRSTSGTSFVVVGTSSTTSFNDPTASPDTAYLYAVRASAGTGSPSPFSDPDLATTVMFTDEPLAAQTTFVKAIHIGELRTAVDAVRTLASLPAGSYTDATVDNTVSIRTAHITDLRAALDEARSALGLPALAYAELLQAGTTTIKTTHIEELRHGVE